MGKPVTIVHYLNQFFAGIGAEDKTILSLTLEAVQRGTSTVLIEGSPPHDPTALDSTGAIVAVQFDSGAALISAD